MVYDVSLRCENEKRLLLLLSSTVSHVPEIKPAHLCSLAGESPTGLVDKGARHEQGDVRQTLFIQVPEMEENSVRVHHKTPCPVPHMSYAPVKVERNYARADKS